jgi:hypothetical protein
MALPDVSVTIRDGALGLTQPGTGNVSIKFGPSPFGIVNAIYSITDPTTLQAALGRGGPLAEAVALTLAHPTIDAPAGNQVLAVPVNPSTYGTVGAVTHTGPGTGTVAVTTRPGASFLVKFVLGGATGVATVVYSYDGGVTYSPTPVVTAATLQAGGGSFTTLAYGAGTAVAGDVITVPTSGNPVLTSGTGTLIPTISSASPWDAYAAQINIVTGGALGAATFTYSLDGGNTVSAPQIVPASGAFVVPDTGLVLTFAGTLTAGDGYAFTTTAASYTSGDLTAAWNAAVADPRMWGFAHVIGAPASSAAGATLLATIDGLLATAGNTFRYASAIMETPQDTDAAILAAYAAASSTRVGVGAGFIATVSPLNGRIQSRNVAWHATARGAKVAPSTDIGRVRDGALPQTPSVLASGRPVLSRDENATPALDAGRFITARSIIGRAGVYLTMGRMMAPAGSDFGPWVNRRVMDIAVPAFRAPALEFVNDTVITNANGTITEVDAKTFDATVGRRGDQVLLQANPPNVAAPSIVTCSRTQNVLSTQSLPFTVRVQPYGYSRYLTMDVGFVNPTLKAA